MKKDRTSIKATWRAVTAVPTEHFPLILPGVHKIAVFFILKKLKRLGYSGCRVDISKNGLVVHARR